MAKPLSDFNVKNKKTGNLVSYCRTCQKSYAHEHYVANSAAYKARARNHVGADRARLANYERLIAYLNVHPCVDCGETDLVVLQFDHVRGEKLDAVSTLLRNRISWAVIAEEINKCEVRCGNCHARKTAARFGYYAYLKPFNDSMCNVETTS